MHLSIDKNTSFIKSEALRLGFAHVGFAKVRRLDEEEDRLAAWLQQGMHGKMHYMENYFEQRLNPALLVEGAQTVISLMYNYYSDKKQQDINAPKLSMYAYGEDYHLVVKRKLKELLHNIQQEIGQFNARVFVDSAPVLERVWAKEAGLGWIGKNSLLLNKQMGSYFFLAEIICDIPLQYSTPVKNHCGTCTACIDACPTDAISEPYKVDGSKCISYATIELKEAIPNSFKDKMDNWMFGCDICQQVCPWNSFSSPHKEPAFEPHKEILNMTKKEWEEITKEVFKQLFKNSAVKRTKFVGLKRNIEFLGK